MEKVSIIIPAYNEEKRIGKTLEEYSRFFKELFNKKILDYEFLIVINNTTDRTEEVVKLAQKKDSKILCRNVKPKGKGLAIIEGFKDALARKNDLIGFVDADMSTKPDAFYDLIKNIGNYGGIIASRYVPGAVVRPKQTIQRIIVSRIFNAAIRSILLIPYRDTQCGAKLFKRKAIQTVLSKIRMSKWAFDVDLLYAIRKEGYKIKECPTAWGDKEDSKLNFIKVGPMMGLAIIRLRLLNSPFHDLIKFYDKIVTRFIWRFLK